MKIYTPLILCCYLICATGMLQAQNIGIGTNTPSGPLSFGSAKNSNGQTISMQQTGIGLGALGNDLVFTMAASNPGNRSILLGHGRSGAFTELMRIQNNRRVGIGTSNPLAALDVNGRIRSKWFGNNTTPGILYSYNNINNEFVGPYFMGMTGLNHFGLLATGAVIFNYDANTGALALNNSFGSAGQIAMVKTNEYTTSWSNLPGFGDVYNGTLQYFEPNAYTITDASPSVTLSGFNLALSYSKYTKIMLELAFTANTSSCALCRPTYFRISTYANGTLANRSTHMIANGRTTTITDAMMLWAGLGTNISINVEKISGPSLHLPANAGRISSIVITPYPIN